MCFKRNYTYKRTDGVAGWTYLNQFENVRMFVYLVDVYRSLWWGILASSRRDQSTDAVRSALCAPHTPNVQAFVVSVPLLTITAHPREKQNYKCIFCKFLFSRSAFLKLLSADHLWSSRSDLVVLQKILATQINYRGAAVEVLK